MNRLRHDEQLRAPLRLWVLAAFLVLLLGAEFHAGLSWIWVVGTYLVFGGVAVFILVFAGHARVQVTDEELVAGRARLPLRFVGRVLVLDRETMHRQLGPAADPAAFVVTRPWIPTGVLVTLDDPDDRTPYWLLGSRRPADLAGALEAARRGA